MWKPVRLGQVSLPEGELLADKKACRRFGPCGVGEKALYLNSFYFDRRFYVPYSSVSRVYKRVAMSKGGFSGKGMFATIPYLVVEYDGGQEKQCIFKREEDVDLLLDAVKERCPGLPLLSAAAEERLKKKEAERAAKVKSDLPEEVKQEIALLEKADSYLQKRPELSVHLSRVARKKRSFQLAGSGYYKAAAAMLLLGVLALAYSVFLLHQKVGFAASIASFGVTVIFLFSGMRMIPAKETNRKTDRTGNGVCRAGDGSVSVSLSRWFFRFSAPCLLCPSGSLKTDAGGAGRRPCCRQQRSTAGGKRRFKKAEFLSFRRCGRI